MDNSVKIAELERQIGQWEEELEALLRDHYEGDLSPGEEDRRDELDEVLVSAGDRLLELRQSHVPPPMAGPETMDLSDDDVPF